MTAKLTAALRRAPATVPQAAALVLLVVWAGEQAGYPLTHWAPGGILVIALLALALAIVGLAAASIPVAVRVAVACLAAYTALSFLSILWAGDQAAAWEGADRTLLYLAIFALFALWRQHGPTAALLLCGWVLAIAALALHAALRLDGADGASLQAMFGGGRLIYPAGYANANAAQWLMAFWPAVLLARSERLPWALRGVLAGAAVLLADVALLSQSRGSLYATPVMLVLVFALLPARVRTFAVLVPVAVAIAATAPAVLRVGNHLSSDAVVAANVHSAVGQALAAALAVGLLVAAAAAVEQRGVLAPRTRALIHRGLAAAALALLLVAVAGGLAAAGNPVTRVRHAWHSFKSGYASNGASDRLVSGLGSNRYDFYRVALDEFAAHPVAGIGADNFQQQYLRHGRSGETPRYPHSVELRTLADTGVLGAVIALAGLAAALVAAALALRRSDPLGRAVAAAALGGFGYWVVHGSFDWFWEFAGLGAPAFAMLGLACALAPSPAPDARPARRLATPLRAALAGAGVLAALVLAASLAAPWISQLEVQDAARVWTHARSAAYSRLRDAAGLDPLSDEADVVAGSIALRYGELARARAQFERALARNGGDPYAALELGAIASSEGRRAEAARLLARAHALAPRDALISAALEVVRGGGTVGIGELNRAILLKARQLS